MITNSQIRAIESSLEKLKPKWFGMDASYKCSVIEENVKWNTNPSNSMFSNSYMPIIKIKTELSGQPNIYFVNSGLIETEMSGFFGKVFSYLLPPDHLLIKRPWAVTYEFKHNGKIINSNDVIKSFSYEKVKTKFRRENSPGTLIPFRESLGYSINYSDLAISEYGDRGDIYIYIECQTESFNYITSSGKVILITDEIWNDLYEETEEPIEFVKESLIKYLNTMSSDYESELSIKFSEIISFREKLSPYAQSEFGWKYEAMCKSLINENEYPYDYTQGDVDRKNLFLNYCHLNLEKD